MLSDPDGFTLLDGEQRLWKSPPRTTMSLESAIKYPGKQPFALSASSGCVHLTNRRVRARDEAARTHEKRTHC